MRTNTEERYFQLINSFGGKEWSLIDYKQRLFCAGVNALNCIEKKWDTKEDAINRQAQFYRVDAEDVKKILPIL